MCCFSLTESCGHLCAVSLSNIEPSEKLNLHMELCKISHIARYHIRKLLEQLMKRCDSRADSLGEPSACCKAFNPVHPTTSHLCAAMPPISITVDGSNQMELRGTLRQQSRALESLYIKLLCRHFHSAHLCSDVVKWHFTVDDYIWSLDWILLGF